MLGAIVSLRVYPAVQMKQLEISERVARLIHRDDCAGCRCTTPRQSIHERGSIFAEVGWLKTGVNKHALST